MNTVPIHQLVQTIGAKEVQRSEDVYGVRFSLMWPVGTIQVSQSGRNNWRALIQLRMVANLFQHGQSLHILKKSLSDLSSFWVVNKIILVKDPSLTRERKVGIKTGPVYLVTKLEPRQYHSFGLQFGKQRLKICSETVRVSLREGRPSPHSFESFRCVGPRRSLRVSTVYNPFYFDSVSVHALCPAS